MYPGTRYGHPRHPIWVGLADVHRPNRSLRTANWVHIPFEEAKMRRQFGATYDRYITQVRRWV
jgi:hypothetical protein